MISSIFGISRVLNSTRAGSDRLPRIGPIASPKKRSIPVHAPPPPTWKNSSGQNLFDAIAATSATNTIATTAAPARDDLEVRPRRRLCCAGNSGTDRGGSGDLGHDARAYAQPNRASTETSMRRPPPVTPASPARAPGSAASPLQSVRWQSARTSSVRKRETLP